MSAPPSIKWILSIDTVFTDGFLLHSPENGRHFPDAALSRTPAVAPVAHASGPALSDGSAVSARKTHLTSAQDALQRVNLQ